MSADEDRTVSALQEQEALWREQEERRQLLQMQIEQQRKVKNFQYLNQAARKGGVLFTGSSLMEGFPVCELCRSAGYELAVYNRGIGGIRPMISCGRSTRCSSTWNRRRSF